MRANTYEVKSMTSKVRTGTEELLQDTLVPFEGKQEEVTSDECNFKFRFDNGGLLTLNTSSLLPHTSTPGVHLKVCVSKS